MPNRRFHPEPRAARAAAARRVCRREPEHVRACERLQIRQIPNAAVSCARASVPAQMWPKELCRALAGYPQYPRYSQVPRAREGRGAHARAAKSNGLRRRPGTSAAESCGVLKRCYRVLQSTAEKSRGMQSTLVHYRVLYGTLGYSILSSSEAVVL